jgi:aminopeptidase N
MRSGQGDSDSIKRMNYRGVSHAVVWLALSYSACSSSPKTAMPTDRIDVHSYGNPHQVRPTHIELDLTADFARKVIHGSATLTVARPDESAPLILDTRSLSISKVETAPAEGGNFQAAEFKLGPSDKILGSPLTITLPSGARRVRVHYETSPEATALQWLEPAQTAGKKHPFLFTQSQAIHARSWIPLQDSPGVRATYRARIRTPKDLIALMSARRDFRLADRKQAPTGDYTFRMPHAIPSYLIALAVGELDSRYISTRTDVWAEPSVVEAAGEEFEDTERMTQAAERLYGPYQWLRYDILVLPPSFPFGGMENPLLTFATPTILAGDKSLVSLVAHELAHSWSGNLVTNATWRDFWLNEGFTVYVERRIQEAVYGVERARMEAVLGRQELEAELATLPPDDQILHIDLKGRDPDDGVTAVAYEKGALFLSHLESVFGREKFDAFLAAWFARYQFQSVTTEDFRWFLNAALLDPDPKAAAQIPVEEWLAKPGIPASAPRPLSDAFVPVDAVAKLWAAGDAPQTKPQTKDWNTQQWLHFLRALPKSLPASRMAALDRAFGFTKSGNSEILCVWLQASIRNGYRAADARLEEFLITIGRRKLLKPLYEELAKTPDGLARARAIFGRARGGYHPISSSTIAAMIEGTGK